MVNIGLGFWIPTIFARTYGWEAARASRIQGLLTMSIGVVGVIAGGWTTDWLSKRGRVDAPLRVGIIGGVGMLVSSTAFPLMATPALAVATLAVVNFFAAFPWGAASAGIAEIAPPSLRSQSAALFFFTNSLLAGTLGPTSVALVTDHVFGESGVRYSMATVACVGMTVALVLFAAGLGSYRRTLAERDGWSAQHGA
jgi:MFS family permease